MTNAIRQATDWVLEQVRDVVDRRQEAAYESGRVHGRAESEERLTGYTERIEATEARKLALALALDVAEARLNEIRALCRERQARVESSPERMFGGGPFPAMVAVPELLTILDAPADSWDD